VRLILREGTHESERLIELQRCRWDADSHIRYHHRILQSKATELRNLTRGCPGRGRSSLLDSANPIHRERQPRPLRNRRLLLPFAPLDPIRPSAPTPNRQDVAMGDRDRRRILKTTQPFHLASPRWPDLEHAVPTAPGNCLQPGPTSVRVKGGLKSSHNFKVLSLTRRRPQVGDTPHG
jgi:hypothetical protein